jgi:uncharacterized iron-regulated membrane protein
LFGHKRRHLRQIIKRTGSEQLRSGFPYPQFIGFTISCASISALSPMHSPPPPGAKPIPADQALEIAGNVLPGATPFAVILPEAQGAYRILLRYPEDRAPGGRSRVLVDQYSGQVLFAEGSRTAPAGARVAIMNRAIHIGDIFGLPSKTILSLASLLLVLQVISGLLMWWKRMSVKKRSGNPAFAQDEAASASV